MVVSSLSKEMERSLCSKTHTSLSWSRRQKFSFQLVTSDALFIWKCSFPWFSWLLSLSLLPTSKSWSFQLHSYTPCFHFYLRHDSRELSVNTNGQRYGKLRYWTPSTNSPQITTLDHVPQSSEFFLAFTPDVASSSPQPGIQPLGAPFPLSPAVSSKPLFLASEVKPPYMADQWDCSVPCMGSFTFVSFPCTHPTKSQHWMNWSSTAHLCF